MRLQRFITLAVLIAVAGTACAGSAVVEPSSVADRGVAEDIPTVALDRDATAVDHVPKEREEVAPDQDPVLTSARPEAPTPIDASERTWTRTSTSADPDDGWYPALALRTDLRPVISHTHAEERDLLLTLCSDARCSQSTTIAVDTVGNVGWYSSIAIRNDDRPIVAYTSVTDRDLVVAICDDPECGSVTRRVVDGEGEVGAYTSIALDSEQRPVISYFDYANQTLKLAICADDVCRGEATTRTLDPTTETGWFTSLALDAEDRPIVAYQKFRGMAGDELRIASCASPSCEESPRIVTLDSGNSGWYPSLALVEGQLPRIAYNTDGDLRLISCEERTCDDRPAPTTLASTRGAGYFASLQLDSAGAPLIAHLDNGVDELQVIACVEPKCAETTGGERVDRSAYTGADLSMVLDPLDRPVIAHHVPGEGLVLIACADRSCQP
ncbi:MAG: hypothetical protein AAF567_25615 [Actinomycetota bacterium]